MPSKFGGIPVDENQGGSKFGGVPVDETPGPATPQPQKQPESHPIRDFISNAGSSLARQGKALVSGLSEPPSVGRVIADTADPTGMGRKIIGGFRQGYEDLRDPTGGSGVDRAITAAGHAAGGFLPADPNEMDRASKQFATGDIAGGIGTTAGTLVPSLLPHVVGGISKMVRAPAAPIAETAMGVRGIDRAYQRSPGRAILDDTNGVRPATVSASAKSRIGELTPQHDAAVAAAPGPVSLQPALDTINQGEQKFVSHNNATAVNQLSPMRAHLTRDAFSGTAIPTDVPPIQALALKRGFGEQFFHHNPETLQPVSAVANKAYHNLDAELDKAAPEAAGLNQRISSLIPVAKRAEAVDRNAGTVQRTLGRFARPTGALAGGIGGAIEGGRLGGIPGAVIGGLTGVGVPELIASPTAQMIAARSLEGAGKGIQKVAPSTRFLPAISNRKRPEQEE